MGIVDPLKNVDICQNIATGELHSKEAAFPVEKFCELLKDELTPHQRRLATQ